MIDQKIGTNDHYVASIRKCCVAQKIVFSYADLITNNTNRYFKYRKDFFFNFVVGKVQINNYISTYQGLNTRSLIPESMISRFYRGDRQSYLLFKTF